MLKYRKKMIIGLATLALGLCSTIKIANAYTLTTEKKYWYSSLTNIKNFSLQATGTYDFPSSYMHNISLGDAWAEAEALVPTWSINSKEAHWGTSTLGVQTSTLYGTCTAGWHIIAGGLDFTQLKEVSMDVNKSITTFID